jgi:SAM-dependent methyltransferase
MQRKTNGIRRRAKAVMRSVSQALEIQTSETESDTRRRIFQDVYKRNLWGGDHDSKFFSGIGSRGDASQIYAKQMATILKQHAGELGHPLTVVDLGCGDFQVGQALLGELPDITYIGCDIVPELVAHNNKAYANTKITFRQLDLVSDPLPDGDVCLVRQVLQHLSNADILSFLKRADYRWIYLTEGQPVSQTGTANPDKPAGYDVRFDWRTGRGRGVELNHPPFNMKIQEMFQVATSPHEIVVTARVFPTRRAGTNPIPDMTEQPHYSYGG